MRALSTFMLASFLMALFTIAPEQKPVQRKPNQAPKIKSFVSSQREVIVCPFDRSGVCATPVDGLLKLKVEAFDPDGDSLNFECKTSGGELEQCGPLMTWNVSRARRSKNTISVTVRDGHGGEDTAQLEINVADCTTCDPPRPPCPVVTISTPKGTDDNKHLVFTVSTEGAERYTTESYHWTASLGKIIKGLHTSEVEIDATGFEGEELTVKVEVGGFDPSCSTVQSQRLLIKQN